jgi:hypothetical protein
MIPNGTFQRRPTMTKWTKHPKWLIAGALAIGATSAFAGRITLYEGQDFQGLHVTTTDSMAIVGSPALANAASSIVVTEGVWEACTDTYFRGRCMQLLPGEYPRANVNLNGRIASVRQVEYAGRATPVVINPQAMSINPQPVVVNPTPIVVNPPQVVVNPTPVVVNPPQVVVNPTPVVVNPPQVVVNPAPVVTNAQPVVVTPVPAVISPPAAVVVNTQPAVVAPPPVVAVAPTGRVVLYEYPNFGGAWAIIDHGQAKDLDWANFSYGHRATSVRVESGTWMFCSEMTFQGECQVLGPGEYPQLSGPLVAGVSSVQQLPRPEYGALTVYSR